MADNLLPPPLAAPKPIMRKLPPQKGPEFSPAADNEETVAEILRSIPGVPVVFKNLPDGIVFIANGRIEEFWTRNAEGQIKTIDKAKTIERIRSMVKWQPNIAYQTLHTALAVSLYREGINAAVPTTTRVSQVANIIVYHLQNYTDGVEVQTTLIGIIQEVIIRANGRESILYQNGIDIIWCALGRVFDFNISDVILYMSSNTAEYHEYTRAATMFEPKILLFEPTMDRKAIKARRKCIRRITTQPIHAAISKKFKKLRAARATTEPKNNQARLPPISELAAEKQ